MHRARALVAITALLLACGLATAANQTILGKQLGVKDPRPGVDATRRKVTGKARETGSANTIVGNPLGGGAVLTIFLEGASSANQAFTLPAAGWRAANNSFKYRDRSGAYGPIKTASISKSSRGMFQIKASGNGRTGLITVLPPNPGTAGCLRLAIASGDTYHVRFGPGSLISRNDARAFLLKKAPSEGLCPGTAPTTTTSTTTTIVGTSSTSTTTTTAVIRCCLPQSSPLGAFLCGQLSAVACAGSGGLNLGVGSCTPDPCPTTTTTTTPAPTVRCCIPGSPMGAFTCEEETSVDCAADGGIDLGAGSCTPNPCPTTTTTTSAPTTTTTTLIPCGGLFPVCLGSCPAGMVCSAAMALQPCTCM